MFHCSGEWLLPQQSTVVPFSCCCIFYYEHPYFKNFNSLIPVDGIRVKFYVGSFLDPTGVPVRVSINNFKLIPNWIVAGLVGMFRNGRGLGTG